MPTAQTTEQSKRSQVFTGIVTSDRMKDTIVVSVSRYVKHAKYGKYQVKKTKIMAHDVGNTKKIGETVSIKACRPISKNKAFRVLK